jgi:hypothetical protein
MTILLLVVVLFVVCGVCFDVSTSQQRVLVVLDTLDVKRTHAAYFKELASVGYELTFKAASDSALELSLFGEFLFEHVLFFAPSANALAGALDSAGERARERKNRIFLLFCTHFSLFFARSMR